MPSESSGTDELYNILGEINDLNGAALDAIYAAMGDGVAHNYRGKWRTQSFAEHLDHAIMHLLALKHKGRDNEDHLSHALCRLAMAVTMEFELEESNDDVDRWESEGGAAVGRPEAMGDSVLGAGRDGEKRNQFELGQVVGHASGLGLREPDRNFEWHCARCGRNHPYIENCTA